MRLSASCEISVSNIGREGGCIALEITQVKTVGEDVTTLLLAGDRARELASVLLQHSAGTHTEGGVSGTTREREEEEAGAVCVS